MGKKPEQSGEGEGLRVFGRPAHRRRTRPAWYWLKSGLLAFIGLINLLAAIGLLVCGVVLLVTGKGEGDRAKADLQISGFSIRVRAEGTEGPGAAAQQHGREVLAAVCFALSIVPFSLAVLARMQFLVSKEMALLPQAPVGSEQQNE